MSEVIVFWERFGGEGSEQWPRRIWSIWEKRKAYSAWLRVIIAYSLASWKEEVHDLLS
jgi:hypothetical protein